MRSKRLGSAGPEISGVGFGTWEAGGMWGTNPPDDEIVRAIQAGLDAGMNWIDTAEAYGAGKSEEIVGRAVKRRPDALVFTKVAFAPAGSGYGAADIRRAAEQSIRRLGRDRIDLYQIHGPSPDFTPEESWAAMAELVDDGLVRWIGVSNFPRELIEACEAIRHVDALQPHFSLLFQQNGDVVRWCEGNGSGVIAYGPLSFGLVTGGITEQTTFGEDDWRSGSFNFIPPVKTNYEALFEPEARRAQLAIVERLRPVADRLGITRAQLAIAWSLHQPGVTGAIVGTRSQKRAGENAAAGAITLDSKDLEEIGTIAGS